MNISGVSSEVKLYKLLSVNYEKKKFTYKGIGRSYRPISINNYKNKIGKSDKISKIVRIQ